MGEARRGDRMWAVALAAGLWGTSALMREPLARDLPAPTIVVFEHLVIVACLSPWIWPALKALASAGVRVQVAMVVIGGGSSALATTLFTAAFTVGDPVTPQVLQKLQPVFAIVLALVLLGERLTPRFAWYALPALAGAWALAFPDPFAVSVHDAQAAGLAVGAALLWAAGTVLGRLVGIRLSFMHVTALRFTIALPVALVLAVSSGAPLAIGAGHVPLLVALALVPGLLALALYYWGLGRTAASRATLAELSFPLVSALVGVTVMGAGLTWSQWAGAAVVLAAVTAMALSRSRTRPGGVVDPAREEPVPA
ncbi:drug/metabolite transporter (DMT)-like permease [Spinactinospora alkalitolerans]|uniref:Drug/metabolite transporter (DMT)-like permease n=1 Tax=Spinactinospora alkalitolerans TaxID=687207 RepID=A0A852TSG6_9ACTN|nr:DMT family transporter [Spinactinospora alkalitolerans]NYE47346.1 drug/metabolite transporter (DMT)-like permease [Spinactinospora alkalitolerans]